MSILTFAIGALLAAVGLTSVYYGYGIVEVERGWTEVIAGTVALVGGMVVMMLALLLRAIRDLRLAAGQAYSASPASSAHAEPFADMTPAPASNPPVPVPSAPMPAAPEPGLAPALETAARQVEAALFGGLEPRADAVAAAPERAGAADDAWHRLDAELARLDREDASFAPATAPATLEPMSAAPAAPPSKLAVEASERDPDSEEPELPLAAPEPSAVIGRYEADGTTYTMFADGTIEAEAPEGTYHFGSMAELKAFIEAKV